MQPAKRPQRAPAPKTVAVEAVRARILIIDDHEVVREGLVATLDAQAHYVVVGAVATGAEGLETARRTKPSLAIIDLRLPDMGGDELCRALTAAVPGIGVVILSTYMNEDTVRRALVAGAAAYVTKAAGLGELINAIDRVAAGSITAPEQASQITKQLHALVAHRSAEVPLTPQEENVLELAARGLTNEQIGRRLYISESTVRFHVQKLKRKLGARTKTELIAKALRGALITPTAEDGVAE